MTITHEPRRGALLAMALAACVTLTAIPAHAQTVSFPTRPVRIVVGLGADSSLDLVARSLAPQLARSWGHPVIVENRVGAAGNVGADAVSRSDDGHALLLARAS